MHADVALGGDYSDCALKAAPENGAYRPQPLWIRPASTSQVATSVAPSQLA
jgi:hypothetical protein